MDYSKKTNIELSAIIHDLEEQNTTLQKRLKALTLERERIGRESKDNYSFLKNIMDSLPLALYYLDHERIIVDCNLTFESLIHKDKSEIIGKNISEIKIEDLSEALDFSPAEYSSDVFPILIKTKNPGNISKMLFYEYSLSNISYLHKGYVGLFFDITHNENLQVYDQTQISKSSIDTTNKILIDLEIDKESRLKDDFLAVISHELRTPLNAIIGMAEALEEGIFGNLSETQSPPLFRIIESSKNLLNILNDVIQLSKIAAGKVRTNISLLDTGATLEKILADYTGIIRQKELSLNIDIPENIKEFFADEKLISRALRNIIDNSVKFTPPKGEIGIKFSIDNESDILMICLSDTGIGIPSERLKSIFQPFLQLDSGLKRQYGGLGLGLALVFRIVDIHGGSIYVKSIVNKGTSFTISLSLENRFFRSHEDGLTADQYLENSDYLKIKNSGDALPKILFISNKKNELLSTGKVLGGLGFKILSSQNFYGVIDQKRTERPGIAFIDIDLLDNEYKNHISEILQYKSLSEIPIIASSSLYLDDLKEKILQVGVSDFIPKPLTIKKILKLINTHLYKL